jgi:hypothetical protein
LTAAGAAVHSNFSFQEVKFGRIATISRLDWIVVASRRGVQIAAF